MIFRHSIQILCWILIVNSAVQNVRAVSFDDIFDYFLDALYDGGESDELDNSNINVPCTNCNLSVVCHNCTTTQRDTQSTLPIQTSTQSDQQITSSSPLPTPTIPAPDRTASSETIAVSPQSSSTTISAPSTATTSSSPEGATTKAINDGEQVPSDEANDPTSADSNTTDGVTDESATTAE